MNIFNSLGSNYDLAFVLKALFAKNNPRYSLDLKTFLEKKYEGSAILLYKGREAIGLTLNILKLPKDSFVAINGFTCFAVYKAIGNKGYNVELIDIEKDDLNFSTQSLSDALRQNPKIKVVIVQNTLGYPCDIEGIAKVCRENNLILIEDLAHCVGAKYENGKEAGTIGDFVVLSFSQDKIIDAISGGALIIGNKKYQKSVIPSEGMHQTVRPEVEESPAPKQQLLDRLYPLFTFIIRKTYPIGIGRLIHFIFKSLNLLPKPMGEDFYAKYSLPSLNALLTIAAFRDINKNMEHRRKIANVYNSMLPKKITSTFVNQNIGLSSNLRYPIFVDKRQDLIGYLKKEDIYVSDIWYDSVDDNLKNAREAADKILNLPTHINVSEEDAKNIAQKINQWLKSQ